MLFRVLQPHLVSVRKGAGLCLLWWQCCLQQIKGRYGRQAVLLSHYLSQLLACCLQNSGCAIMVLERKVFPLEQSSRSMNKHLHHA